MRISYSLGSLLTIEQVLECSRILSATKTDTVWIPETWGMENFTMLGIVSQYSQNSKIGSSIINIYSRSPSSIAMGAATIDTVSKGRLILGLGTSSIPIVEDFHGYKFEKPVTRMKEYVEIIRLALSGKKISYDGRIFNLKNFSLLIKPPREHIPIYLAAVNQKMVNLAWEIADGVIFYLRPINELKETIQKMQQKKKLDVTCQLITCVSEDSEVARTRAKQTLAFYVSVGKIYREFLAKHGYESETSQIFEEFKRSGFKTNYELVTDKMLSELTVCGTPDECKKQLVKFNETGINLPIIQFNPVGDVGDSFKLFVKTFSDEK
ncbi:LLM class flavin-dependent oxidoreductase [Nitrosopumilus sp. K4]|uniref:LLM class flavin-dependent oxidoreductase n=1 Tax=Nitrosopumilus sp. K4 TaxID=2795383 RepID=UPI001BA9E657|nr:LLM class flavin-dependent oxidoreductase [Nitrosopumilus sp. K4]QUC65428.1 LLM class flavin-dependent oxidoreductase [Nitrosopumilus sp. K4]